MRARPPSSLQGELMFQAEPTVHDKADAIENRIIIPSNNRQVPAVVHSSSQVTKHNAMAEARYFLSARAQKFLFFAISKIDPEDTSLQRMYTIHAAEFAEWAQISLQSVRRDFWDPPAKQKEVSIGMELLSEVLVIPNYFQPERGRATDLGTHWFHAIMPETPSGPCGYLDVNFSPRLAPMLLQLRGNYYRVNKIAIRKFDSRYTIRLFEWIESWSYLQSRVENRMNIGMDTLRGILGTDRPTNISPRKGLGDKSGFVKDGIVYERRLEGYGHFRQVALDVAIKEINLKTDYHVTVVPKRRMGSKAICSFDFEVHPKTKMAIIAGLEVPKASRQSQTSEPMLFAYPPRTAGSREVSAPTTPTLPTSAEAEIMPPGMPWPTPHPFKVAANAKSPATATVALSDARAMMSDEAQLDAMVEELVGMYQLHPKQRDLAGYARTVGGCVTAAECAAWLQSIHDRVRRDELPNPARTFIATVKGQFTDGRRVKLRAIVNPLAPSKIAPPSAPAAPVVEAPAPAAPGDSGDSEEDKSRKAAIASHMHEFRVKMYGPQRAAMMEEKARQQQAAPLGGNTRLI